MLIGQTRRCSQRRGTFTLRSDDRIRWLPAYGAADRSAVCQFAGLLSFSFSFERQEGRGGRFNDDLRGVLNVCMYIFCFGSFSYIVSLQFIFHNIRHPDHYSISGAQFNIWRHVYKWIVHIRTQYFRYSSTQTQQSSRISSTLWRGCGTSTRRKACAS